jgi:hypothetical protein
MDAGRLLGREGAGVAGRSHACTEQQHGDGERERPGRDASSGSGTIEHSNDLLGFCGTR